MKKFFVLFLLVSIASSGLKAQDIKWYSWNEGYEKALEEQKPMLVFVNATWCHVCIRMLEKTFSEEEVKSLISTDFIAVNFDFEKKETYTYKGKKYKGGKLLSKLTDNKCQGIPSTVFVDTQTNKIILEGGFRDFNEMQKLLLQYKEIL